MALVNIGSGVVIDTEEEITYNLVINRLKQIVDYPCIDEEEKRLRHEVVAWSTVSTYTRDRKYASEAEGRYMDAFEELTHYLGGQNNGEGI